MVKVFNATYGSGADLDLGSVNDWYVAVECPRGNVYVLNHIFESDLQAQLMVKRVRERGTFNPEHWTFFRVRYATSAYEADVAEAYHYVKLLREGKINRDEVLDYFRVLILI